MDYFTLFGLPVSYTLSQEQLAVRYQDLQRQYHPDKFASASAAEQLASVQQSATINQAWQTLRHPLTRAEYLLSLHGYDWPASSTPCAIPLSDGTAGAARRAG
jgi:molecular chaperone HscB